MGPKYLISALKGVQRLVEKGLKVSGVSVYLHVLPVERAGENWFLLSDVLEAELRSRVRGLTVILGVLHSSWICHI